MLPALQPVEQVVASAPHISPIDSHLDRDSLVILASFCEGHTMHLSHALRRETFKLPPYITLIVILECKFLYCQDWNDITEIAFK